MNTVRLRHPKTGAKYDAPESAVDTYARSGWEIDDTPEPEPVKTKRGKPAEKTEHAEKTSATPRGRRSSKGDE